MRALTLTMALFCAGCFGVDEPQCSFACGPNGECPDDYQCMSDGYCHLHGNNDPCGFSDASVPDLTLTSNDLAHADLSMENEDGGPDLSAVDLAMSQDLSHADLSHADLSHADLSHADLSSADLAHADLSHVDLTPPPDLCNVSSCPPMANTCVNNVITGFTATSCACSSYTPMTVTTCTNGCFNAACTAAFSSVGSTTAAQGATSIPLDTTGSNMSSTLGGPASHTTGVSVTTISMPGGTVQSMTLVWSLDPTMAAANQNPITMSSTAVTSGSETWKATIPAQAAGMEVYFFIDAHPYSGSDGFDPNGFGIHYAYAVQ